MGVYYMDEIKSLIGCGLTKEMRKVHILLNREPYKTKWIKWFDRNFIYCESSHSFVHRMFNKKKSWKTYKDAQNDAFKTLDEMRLEFLYLTYNKKDIKKEFENMKNN